MIKIKEQPLEEHNLMSADFLKSQFEYNNLLDIKFIAEPALKSAIEWLREELKKELGVKGYRNFASEEQE